MAKIFCLLDSHEESWNHFQGVSLIVLLNFSRKSAASSTTLAASDYRRFGSIKRRPINPLMVGLRVGIWWWINWKILIFEVRFCANIYFQRWKSRTLLSKWFFYRETETEEQIIFLPACNFLLQQSNSYKDPFKILHFLSISKY